MKATGDERNKLFEILNNETFTTEFISGIAGDRILNPSEKALYDRLLSETGGDLYVKLLFYITHQVFAIEKAKILWEEILVHKGKLARALKRNVEISVATLDYLTNIKDEIENPKLIGEAFIGKIAEMASIDGLTKLYNRSYLLSKVAEELKRYKRYEISFSLLFLDVDNFKKINDAFGHQKGDKALMQLTTLITETLRELDICGRYGGDEFIIVLPHTDRHEAKELAERIRIKVEKYFAKDLKLTISIGISNCPRGALTKKSLLKRADEALYASKTNGRNRSTLN